MGLTTAATIPAQEAGAKTTYKLNMFFGPKLYQLAQRLRRAESDGTAVAAK